MPFISCGSGGFKQRTGYRNLLPINDHYCKIYIHRTKRELLDFGAVSIREAQEDLFLAHSPTTRYTNPFLHLLYLARRANWTIQWKVFEFDRQAGRRSLVGLSFPMRKEHLYLPGQDGRRKQLSKYFISLLLFDLPVKLGMEANLRFLHFRAFGKANDSGFSRKRTDAAADQSITIVTTQIKLT